MWRLCSQIEPQLPAELTVLPDVEVLVKAGEPPTVRAPDVVVTREARAYTLVDGNYEHVAGDIAGTVTTPAQVGTTLTLGAVITR